MAAYQISPFDFSKLEEWIRWIRRFERFQQASDLTSKTEESQVNTLIYTMGNEAEDILSSFSLNKEDKKKYDTVKEKFENVFVKKRNVIYERARFNQRKQQEGENVDSFVTSLHT